jgi:DNA-binding PadR family transcriptional regulator
MALQEQIRKGTTEIIILSLLADLERAMYGYEIIKELESRSEGFFEFKEGLIYPRLHEMERQGLLRSEWRGKEGSRKRKFYAITTEGRRQLARDVESWQAFAENVSRLLGVEPA